MTNWEIPRRQADLTEDMEQDNASEIAFNNIYGQSFQSEMIINAPMAGDSEVIDLTKPQLPQNTNET